MLKYLITSIQNEKGCGFQVNKWITLIKFNTIKSGQSILYIEGHRKVWKFRDPQTCSRFHEVFKAHVPAVETEAATTTEEIWAKLKTGLLKTTEEVCGTTKPHRWRPETWWWNKEVDDAITAKPQAFKAWKAGKCTRASYNTAKRISRRMVHHACHEADKVVYVGIDHKSSDIFCLANQMRKENVDVVGDKPVKNDTGEMSMREEAKQNA